MKHTNCIVVLYIFLYLLFLPAFAEEGKKVDMTQEQQQFSDNQKILMSAANFRSSLLDNYQVSLKTHASTKVQLWFKSINEEWWHDIPGKLVWQRLLLDAQMLLTNVNSNPLAIFYTVWPDVYFITEWRMVKGSPQIIDAEMVSGDFFRFDPDRDLESTPLWSRHPPYLVSEIENSVVVSLKQADKIFLKSEGKNWRKAGGLDDPLNNRRLLESKVFARKNILENLSTNVKFYASDEKEVSSMRAAISELLLTLYLGVENDYFVKNKIIIDNSVKDFLLTLDKRFFRKARVIALVKDLKGVWIFIAFRKNPQTQLAVRLKVENGDYFPQLIDAADFLGAYENDTQ